MRISELFEGSLYPKWDFCQNRSIFMSRKLVTGCLLNLWAIKMRWNVIFGTLMWSLFCFINMVLDVFQEVLLLFWKNLFIEKLFIIISYMNTIIFYHGTFYVYLYKGNANSSVMGYANKLNILFFWTVQYYFIVICHRQFLPQEIVCQSSKV